MSNKVTKGVAGLIALGTIISAPIVPVEMKWVNSYETVAFETSDGDLGMNEYAIAREGEWYIREVPKNERQFVSTTSPSAIVGKQEVFVTNGNAYYSRFENKNGDVLRYSMSKTEYDGLRYIPEYPQPKKRELQSI